MGWREPPAPGRCLSQAEPGTAGPCRTGGPAGPLAWRKVGGALRAGRGGTQSLGTGSQETWLLAPAVLCSHCVTLGKSLSLSWPPFCV